MAKKRIGELPSGNIRKQVFLGYELIFDEKGKPVIDSKTGKQKKKRIYESVTASSVKEANRQAAQLKLSKEKKPKTDLRFYEARLNYIESKRNILSPSTVRGYMQMSSYFGSLDSLKLSEINNLSMQNWVNLFSSNHAPKTVKNAYGFITAVLSSYNIKVSAALPAKQQTNLYVPSDSDVQCLIQHFIDKGDKDMLIAIYLAAFATLRRSEICALDAHDLDRKAMILHVHDSMVVNDKQESVRKQTTKTLLSDRFIELPKFVIEQLPRSGPLVSIKPDVITNRFCRALKKHNIPKFRFHDLRHYSASIMHAIGIPDVYIMDRGGWKSDTTLKKIYRGTIEDYKQQFVNQTNSYFEKLHENQV